MRARFTLTAEVRRSARVMQTAGMMDSQPDTGRSSSWDVDVPIEDKPWNVGLVVGPSGSGKSSLARHLWADHLAGAREWTDDAAILDDFPDAMSIREITKLLVDVGLGSVPAWLRPYRALSMGEAFRADTARSLAEADGLVVVDEFTSVVDRQVAKIASHSVQRTVRRAERQFIAVTCHYDVIDWLQPDWVLDMAAGQFAWRSVQPHPPIELRLHQVDASAWRVFARHHYLTSSLHTSARCFGAFADDGECVGFTSYMHFPHARTRNIKLAHRTVVLPDWQGLGISGRMADWVGQYLYEHGYRYHRSIAHPAVIAYCVRSPRWREVSTSRRSLMTSSTTASLRKRALSARSLGQRSFEYVPPAPFSSTS
ncbi:MAG TPA: GNAT family N-acetyltransferase [Pseudonocardiaceae bacterium]|nr:GNAT family N-acetyltransferase [Pseudonocardiaceae bacterium]